ncbi:MAG: hypothetical protein M1825_003561 [Sarcosagium campestre]|nr:MAG: hypothetical protein M1825_003561 [Sarcosagium campestre]
MDPKWPPSHREPDLDISPPRSQTHPLTVSLPTIDPLNPDPDLPVLPSLPKPQTPSSPLRRKPLPSTSPKAPSIPAASRFSSLPDSSVVSVNSNAPTSDGSTFEQDTTSELSSHLFEDLDRNSIGQSLTSHVKSSGVLAHTDQSSAGIGAASEHRWPAGSTFSSQSHARQSHVRLASESSVDHRSRTVPTEHVDTSSTAGPHRETQNMPLLSSKPQNLSLNVDPNSRSLDDSNDNQSKPRSPGSKLGSFFGWKSSSPGAASSTTTFSDRMPSRAPSPNSPKSSPQSSSPSNRSMPTAIDVLKANAALNDGVSSRLDIPSKPDQVDEMEEELRDISSELASSIRREMDLEDLVERLQSEANNPTTGQNRRTSDYFSDSGTSSVRYPLGDAETKEVELEKSQRKIEQEKAQLRLDLAQKVQDERLRRKALEEHVEKLERQVQKVDHDQLKSADASGRVKELETTLDDLRRRLSEERQVKENFEDLLSALRGEIEEHRNERDNLRDEIVPRLRARVEGLESEAAEFQKLTYEHTRMQQEVQALKDENATLANARKLQLEMQQQQSRFNSIAEEGASGQPKAGLSRSNSLARGSMQGSRSGGLGRSNTVMERESRESLADRVKDIEAQRDALHRALRSLLERQDHQNGETAKRIKALEAERDRALEGSPRRAYDREVSTLREEINHLRRRADEALEQKWQCEKGLSGLKMDLDRAEQETSSLRSLLQEHDILIPVLPDGSGVVPSAGRTTSASLEKAYKELQTTHALTLARVHELQRQGSSANGSGLGVSDGETAQTMDLLKKSISNAEADRDAAQMQAEQYRQQAESLRVEQRNHVVEESGLASQLQASAARVEDLAMQVRKQLESNNRLRQRLADAIGRGESQQKSSATRITELQGKLRVLEDKLMAAQHHSEEVISKHEEEIKEIQASHNQQLQRMKSGFKSPTRYSLKSPGSPLFSARSPRLSKTTSGIGMSMTEASKRAFLEKRVEELEAALSLADKEMEEVVGVMNFAQIEVVELQSERDDAMRRTRKLQQEIDEERSRFQKMMK